MYEKHVAFVRIVNARWRLLWVAVLAIGLLPGVARADAVALLSVDGRAAPERLEEVESTMGAILREQGHRLVSPAADVSHPPSSAEMEAAAGSALYVVAAEVEPLRGQYRLHIHVYYRPAGRMEDLVVTVLEAEERERLADILASMVRREGIGEDALRLTGEEDPDEAARRAEEERLRREEEERRAREESEAAQREEEERLRAEAAEAARIEEEEAARRAAEAEQEAETAWEGRPRYGADGPWMIQGRVGGRVAVLLGGLPNPTASGQGGLFDLGVRVGRSFEGLEGFELRGGVDFATGIYTGLALHVGAAWLGSFFVEPIYIGGEAEVGAVFTLTGARDVGFSGHLSALVAWRPTERFYLEASLPEIGLVTPGAGALTIGASLRAGYRF
ncbi:MAG: hypothetical protein SangKO_033440 [Sandaracinaceae bacterium]